jgi:hypothetical protein
MQHRLIDDRFIIYVTTLKTLEVVFAVSCVSYLPALNFIGFTGSGVRTTVNDRFWRTWREAFVDSSKVSYYLNLKVLKRNMKNLSNRSRELLSTQQEYGISWDMKIIMSGRTQKGMFCERLKDWKHFYWFNDWDAGTSRGVIQELTC